MTSHQAKKPHDIKGLCYISSEKPTDYIELPDHGECVADKAVFTKMFHEFYQNNDYITAKGLAQKKQDTRYLIQNPPAEDPTRVELNSYYELPYTYELHPYYAEMGHVKAMETIKKLSHHTSRLLRRV